jgi:hypothetical protein
MKWYIVLIGLIFTGCATSTHPNQWQYDSSSYFEEYKSSYLKGDSDLAKDFLTKALKSAKSSSNLDTLASIELGRVALRVALFKSPNFAKYKRIEPLIKSKELKAYAKLLAKKLTPQDVKNLPRRYQEFAKFYLRGDFDRAKRAIKSMKNPLSKMVAGALIKNHLDDETISNIVESISFYGYRVGVIRWLEFWKNRTKDRALKKKLAKKLAILKA